MDVRVESHIDELIAAKDSAVERALEAIGLQCEGYAIALCPTDTGLLANSITHAVGGYSPSVSSYRQNQTHADSPATRRAKTAGKSTKGTQGEYSGTMGRKGDESVYIGTNVEYAKYVEFGHQSPAGKQVSPQPFLRPAVQDHLDEYKRIAEQELKNA